MGPQDKEKDRDKDKEKIAKSIICSLFREEKGAVAVLVAIGMTALLGMAALVTDVGLLYYTRAQLVDSADAAVLAGAQELPMSPQQAIARAEEYLGYNTPGDSHSITVSADNRQLLVSITKEVKLLFAPALGISSSEVSAASTGMVGAITSYMGAAPLAIPDQTYSFGTLYRLKSEAGDDHELGSGNYGALALGGKGSSIYEYNLKYGYPDLLRVGQIVDTESGNMSGPTKRAIDWRIAQCNHSPSCTHASHVRGCPKILIVPIYEPADVDLEQNKVKKVRILGFAAFLVEEVIGQGNENEIVGRFIRIIEPGEINQHQRNYGAQGVKLL